MDKINAFTEFSLSEDVSFFWDEFKVVVERCDINIMKIALYAVDGLVRNRMGSTFPATKASPCQVLIPYDRLGNLLSVFQDNLCRNVTSISFMTLSYIYVFTDLRHGQSPKI